MQEVPKRLGGPTKQKKSRPQGEADSPGEDIEPQVCPIWTGIGASYSPTNLQLIWPLALVTRLSVDSSRQIESAPSRRDLCSGQPTITPKSPGLVFTLRDKGKGGQGKGGVYAT